MQEGRDLEVKCQGQENPTDECNGKSSWKATYYTYYNSISSYTVNFAKNIKICLPTRSGCLTLLVHSC